MAFNIFAGTLAPAAITAIPLRNSRLAQIDFINDPSCYLKTFRHALFYRSTAGLGAQAGVPVPPNARILHAFLFRPLCFLSLRIGRSTGGFRCVVAVGVRDEPIPGAAH